MLINNYFDDQLSHFLRKKIKILWFQLLKYEYFQVYTESIFGLWTEHTHKKKQEKSSHHFLAFLDQTTNQLIKKTIYRFKC